MDEYIHMGCYLLVVCLFVYRLAQYESFIEIRVPYSVRLFLLILSFKRKRISAMCVVSQIYAYIMIGLFIASRFHSLEFLSIISNDPNTFYDNLLKFHYIVLIPVAIIEAGICYLVRKHRYIF